tara:strand:+ start:78 stop:359 length:282 start_codon:yes stop_codon:yes gene_type:complete
MVLLHQTKNCQRLQKNSYTMNTVHIEKFINMVNANEQTRQPIVKMPMNDAKQLRDNLSTLLTYVVEKQDELIDTQKKLIDSQTITVEMKGDNF